MAVPALRVLEDKEGGNGKKIKKNDKSGIFAKGSGISICDSGDSTVIDVIDERGFVDSAAKPIAFKHRVAISIHPSTVIAYRVEMSVTLCCHDSIAFVRTSSSPIPKEEFAPQVNGLRMFWAPLPPLRTRLLFWGQVSARTYPGLAICLRYTIARCEYHHSPLLLSF